LAIDIKTLVFYTKAFSQLLESNQSLVRTQFHRVEFIQDRPAWYLAVMENTSWKKRGLHNDS